MSTKRHRGGMRLAEEFVRSDGILGVQIFDRRNNREMRVHGDTRHWLPADRERAAAWLLEHCWIDRENGETLHDAAYRTLFGR